MISHPFSLLKPYASRLDVQLFLKEDAMHGEEDVRRLLKTKNVMGPKQVHGNRAVVVRASSWRKEEADAVFTGVPGLTLVVSFADCQGLVLFEPKERVIGVIHAGWRTVAANIIIPAFQVLKDEWNIVPQDVFVALSPSLCTKCAGFSDPLREVPALRAFARGKCIDLRAALERQLSESGVPKKHIERMEGCTRCQPERYWTYRGGDREAVREGYTNCLAATLRGSERRITNV